MDKKARYQLYKNAIGPGWWSTMDQYISQASAIDPDCKFHVDEIRGSLQFFIFSNKIDMEQKKEIEKKAAIATSKVCDCCGAAGALHKELMPPETLCDRCCSANIVRIKWLVRKAERQWQKSAT